MLVGEWLINKLLRALLYPLQQFVQLNAMINCWCMPNSLQGGHEHGDVNARVDQVGYRSQQGPVQAVQLRAALLIWFPTPHLHVFDALERVGIGDLIQRDLLGGFVLYVSHTTVREVVPQDLELTEVALEQGKDGANESRLACHLDVVDMDCYHANQSALRALHA